MHILRINHTVRIVVLWKQQQLQHDRAQEWAHARLTTIGESCRAMFRATLGKTIAWVVQQVQLGQSVSDIKAYLALP